MFENNSIRIPEWPPGVHDDESSPPNGGQSNPYGPRNQRVDGNVRPNPPPRISTAPSRGRP